MRLVLEILWYLIYLISSTQESTSKKVQGYMYESDYDVCVCAVIEWANFYW